MMNDSQAEGTVNEAKGNMKEVVGKLIGDRNLEAQGVEDQAVGKLQQQIGNVAEVLTAVLNKL